MDVKTACLGVLTMGDATGYEIRKQFEDGPFSIFVEGGYGSIYPALNRLTDEGCVTCSTESQDKRPDRKVYSITAKGKLALVDRLRDMPGPDKFRSDFLFTLFFAEHLPARLVEAVIDARIAECRSKLEHMRQCGQTGHGSAGHAFVHQFGVTYYEMALNYLEENKHVVVAATLRGETMVAE